MAQKVLTIGQGYVTAPPRKNYLNFLQFKTWGLINDLLTEHVYDSLNLNLL